MCLDIDIVVDIRQQGGMLLNITMPGTVHGDVVQSVMLIVLQIEVNEILHGSALYGRNRQNTRCDDGNPHGANT